MLLFTTKIRVALRNNVVAMKLGGFLFHTVITFWGAGEPQLDVSCTTAVIFRTTSED